ncbi:RNA polymerase sigma factor [Chitinophaga rhizophila]|uniref:Sigma-70 family RNA polymerase sigma factor n=1 Tax=Chitinophaga rhizophila TaxID=2866212 RepID=A0ABS7G7D8_9BACT|nr:sigma-70 family RNA polymerase sigma factor [Chitinophaga rhizophila]MBW8682709.1 sigma-70 family RNA polymerase sigma factor [Chitinophaga rhizophila]
MDEKQFLDQLTLHQQVIHKICWLYRDSKEDREDLFQEIVFQLWKSASSFEGKSLFSSWLYKVALNTALASFRKKQPNISYPETLPDLAAQNTNDEQQNEELIWALRQLNDADKAVITLYLEGLSYQEIAAILGISENNTGVKINRIKSKLQQLLQLKK